MNRFSLPFRTTLFRLLFLTSLTIIASLTVQAQKTKNSSHADEENPLFQEYRGVRLGMTADETRKKLGAPQDKGDEQDFYTYGETESAQVFYDKTRKVFAISVNFLTGARDLPVPKTILGADLQAKPDGSMYKLVRYPKTGYWVSYSRTSGDSPLTTVTLQKIE